MKKLKTKKLALFPIENYSEHFTVQGVNVENIHRKLNCFYIVACQ